MGNKVRRASQRFGSKYVRNVVHNEDADQEFLPILWLNDPSNLTLPKAITVRDELKAMQTVIQFNSELECEKYICELPLTDKILVVIDKGISEDMAPRMNLLCQVACIFICGITQTDNISDIDQNSLKIRYVLLNQLSFSIKVFQMRRHRCVNKLVPDILKTKDEKNLDVSSTGIHRTFLYFQILVNTLLQTNSLPTNKNELVDMLIKQYTGDKKQLENIELFYNLYTANEAIDWYTRDSFIYRLLNGALRVQNVELLFLFRFFIRDMQQQLNNHRCHLPVKVYRGQYMSMEELNRLRESIGDLISMKSFLSTSMNRNLAEVYLGPPREERGIELIPVLFEIDAHPDEGDEDKPFADITQLSHFGTDEEEVLFMIGCVFRLTAIRQENLTHIISMKLCKTIEHDLYELIDFHESTRNNFITDKMPVLALADILETDDNLREKLLKRALYELSFVKIKTADDNLRLTQCYYRLGFIALRRKQNKIAVKWFQKILNILTDQTTEQSPAEKLQLSKAYSAMAASFYRQKSYKRSLDYYNVALDVFKGDLEESASEEHLHIARIYNYMGGLYCKMKQDKQAYLYYEKSLIIKQKCLPQKHPDLAVTHSDMARFCLLRLHDHELSLKHIRIAVDIDQRFLPRDDPELAMSFTHLGLVYTEAGEIELSDKYYNSASRLDPNGEVLLQPPAASLFGITSFRCPLCQHRVWIYKIFRIFKGFPCFRCIRKTLTCRR